MPRRVWTPKKCEHPRLRPVHELSTTLRLWKEFVHLNRHLGDPMSVLFAFAEQQLEAGLKASTVRTRIEEVASARVPYTSEQFAHLYQRRQLIYLKKYLLQKQNKTGVRHKVPWSLSIQTLPLSFPEKSYALWWFVLLATGLRPGNLWHAEILLEDEQIRVFCTQGTKSKPKSTRRPRIYDFLWSVRPADWMKAYFHKNRSLPRIAKKETIASHINSWLKRNKPPVPITSCCPRARMDQILRKLVSEGCMSTDEFEWLLDHTIETSNESYFAQL